MQQQKIQCQKKYILMSYRKDIIKCIQSTYYTSDTGWGCMLRVGQMMIANLIYRNQKASMLDVIRLFYDNQLVPFSIQLITKIAKQIYPDKKPYQWFSPCQCGFIIKQSLENYDSFYRVSICNDNTLFLSDIITDKPQLLIILMCRIGLDQPEKPYLNCVIHLTKNPYFFAIMGGTPKRAHLFLQYKQGKFGYLDPHQTLQTTQNIYQLQNHLDQYQGKLQWLKQNQIDTSMALCFYLRKQQLEQFWNSLQQLKKQLGQSFFLYMQKQKPDYENLEIIQIDDDI